MKLKQAEQLCILLLDIVYFVNGCLSFMHKYFFEQKRKMMLLLEKKNMRNHTVCDRDKTRYEAI
jgi:hypothetical protein